MLERSIEFKLVLGRMLCNLFIFETSYPAQGSTDSGDQSLCPLAEASIEVRAKFCMDCPYTGIVSTWEIRT